MNGQPIVFFVWPATPVTEFEEGKMSTSIEELSINTIRTLSMDAVQRANSGHPGTPMALAPLAYVLWQEVMNYDPEDAHWMNRDRFVLSNGHASMLLYSMLHLSDVRALTKTGKKTGKPAVSLTDIKNFRQINSLTPGHPEHGFTTGVETTTGPLGQGIATSVGMAIAERWLAARYNKPGQKLFDYNVYAICGDGCLMEGVSSEAASLAGHLGLSNLCWFYDNNHITIEGKTSLAYSDDVAARFMGYGWDVTRVGDVNDLDLIRRSIKHFKATSDKPTLVIVDSHIGYGSPNKQDTASAHGEALGVDEIKLTKKFYKWPQKDFYVPKEVMPHFKAGLGKRGKTERSVWQKQLSNYKKKHPVLAKELDQILKYELPKDWQKALPKFQPDAKGMASRVSGGQVLNALSKKIPWLVGGAADLAPSTMTWLKDSESFERSEFKEANFHFGIREFGMSAAMNGMVLSGLRPFGATFFNFCDYAKPAVRLSALMEMPVIYVYTHDSIGLGEDGPTHQPIEQLAQLRAMPQMNVFRPADANEVSMCYRLALEHNDKPSCMVLSRQALPTLDRSKYASEKGALKGGYIIADCEQALPDVILIATGSEVHLCIEAYEKLKEKGIAARVVSLPCFEIFDVQPKAYRNKVLPPKVTARVSVEQASPMGWEKYVGLAGCMIAMNTFGKSAPYKDLQKVFGFTVDNIVKVAKKAVGS